MKGYLLFNSNGFSEYEYWQGTDLKKARRIIRLIKAIWRKEPMIGKPEPLKNNLKGNFSLRIDEKNRLVYEIHGDNVFVKQCRGHYQEDLPQINEKLLLGLHNFKEV